MINIWNLKSNIKFCTIKYLIDFLKFIQFHTYELCRHMDAMSARQILVIKTYEKRHYHLEKIVTIIQMNLFMMILLNF
jgi:hypothetical protein